MKCCNVLPTIKGAKIPNLLCEKYVCKTCLCKTCLDLKKKKKKRVKHMYNLKKSIHRRNIMHRVHML